MGVTNQNRSSSDQGDTVDDMLLIENLALESDDNASSHPRNRQQAQMMRHIDHKRMAQAEMARLSKRRVGMRQARRCENMNHLLGLVETEDCVDSSYLMDLMEPSISPFSTLFMEQEKMKVWNDFINRSEEEQRRVLQEGTTEAEEVVYDNNQAMDDEAFTILDKRDFHPGFAAADSFKRIDGGLKAFLKRKDIPRGMLEHLEKEIIPFFEEWPSSIYISYLSESIERLLLHALCQYLNLSSQSFDDDSGLRQTQVENKNDGFNCPNLPLSKFLLARH